MRIEELKQYIKENKNIEKYYFTGLKEKTLTEKFNFIKEHFTYDIMNSWNKMESIANNVKIYNLGLTTEQENKFFELLNIEEDYIYEDLNWIIQDFERETKTDVFFNGRSSGYLVIIPDFKTNNRWQNILDLFFEDNIYDYKNYKEYKQEQNKYTGGCYYQSLPANYSRKEEIEQAYYLIKAFDKLCDVLRAELIYILDNATIKEEKEMVEQTRKYIEL